MKLSYVLLAVVSIGCGGGGGGYPTSTGNGNGNGTGTGTGTGSGTGTASGTASVSMTSTDDGYGYASFSFSPSSVTITKGGTVTWTNGGGTVAHNVTFTTAGAPANVELHQRHFVTHVQQCRDVQLSMHEPSRHERDSNGAVIATRAVR